MKIWDCKPGDLVIIEYFGDKCIILNVEEHYIKKAVYLCAATYYSVTENILYKLQTFNKDHPVKKIS